MCGHAIIALTKYVLEMGLVLKTEENPLLKIDAPPGLITARAFRKGNIVEKVSFQNVPSFVLMADEKIEVEGLREVCFDVAYGGAFYALVDAEKLGLKLHKSNYYALIDAGRKIKHAIMKNFSIKHPCEEDLSFLYGTIFTSAADDPKHHSRNVCIFADAEVDRSATGSGVSARAALHHAKGELQAGQKITIESILGSTMEVEVVKTIQYGPHAAVIPEVTGTAFFTGRNEFWFDPADPLRDGFLLR
jgi:trans-L-3-hydroxyproline dehydratase